MDEYESLSHSKWECKYHVISFPNAVARHCIKSSGSTWARYSGTSPIRSRAGLRRPFDG